VQFRDAEPPTFELNDAYIAATTEAETVVDGLPTSSRRRIYASIMVAARRATSDGQFGFDMTNREHIELAAVRTQALRDMYEVEVCRRFGISREIAKRVWLEGFEKGWCSE
jgi:hypothetical protein